MKKNIRVTIFTLILCISSALIFSGCKKDDVQTETVKGIYILPTSQASSVEFKVSAKDSLIHFTTGITQPASENVNVKIAIDNSLIGAFNTAYNSTHIALPAGSVQLKADNVTIASGQKFSTKDSLKFNHLLLNPSLSYLLPLKIESASGGGIIVVPAMAVKYFIIKVKPPYEGMYVSSGSRSNFNSAADAPANPVGAPGPFGPFDYNVTWVTGNTYKVHAGNANQASFGTMNITVNADNTVTVQATAETILTGLVPTPGKTSTYDPATKTFQLYYEWTNLPVAPATVGTFRMMDHKLVFK